MTDDNWQAIFRAADSIGSDREARLVLVELVKFAPQSESVTELALNSLGSIGSDREMRMAVTGIVTEGRVGNEGVALAIEQINRSISSDRERVLALEVMSEFE